MPAGLEDRHHARLTSGVRRLPERQPPQQQARLLLGDAARKAISVRISSTAPMAGSHVGAIDGEREARASWCGPGRRSVGRMANKMPPCTTPHRLPAPPTTVMSRNVSDSDWPEVLLRHDPLDRARTAPRPPRPAPRRSRRRRSCSWCTAMPQRRRHPLVVAQGLDGPARLRRHQPPVEQHARRAEHEDAEVGRSARRSRTGRAGAPAGRRRRPVSDRMLNSVSWAKRP